MAADMRGGRRTTADRPAAVELLNLRTDDIAAIFKQFSESVKAELSTDQVREFLEANSQDTSGSDVVVLRRCQDLLFYGPLDKCPVCNGNNLEFTGYYCECIATNCIYRSKYPPRKQGPIKYPISILKQMIPRYNPDFDPPYVGNQGFFARFWADFWRPHNYGANRVELTLDIYQDAVEINGRRITKRMCSICVLVFVLICFFTVLWSTY